MAGWQPQGYDPRQQRPAVPDPWGPSAPPRQPGWVPPEQVAHYGQPQAGWGPQQYQQPQYPPPGPPQQRPRKSRKGLFAVLGCGGLAVFVILIAVIAGSSSSSSAPPAAQQQPAAPAQPAAKAAPKAAAAQTVTYVVTGSAADVTYGPAGTDLSGSVPLRVTRPLGTPIYYAITAQLQGGGTVSCKIEVNGKVISQSTASGGYQIADCEISQDPFSGNWSDTNSG